MTSFLNRRAWGVAIGTKHAAVAFFRFQNGTTARTFPKILAGIGRHFLS